MPLVVSDLLTRSRGHSGSTSSRQLALSSCSGWWWGGGTAAPNWCALAGDGWDWPARMNRN